MKNETNKTLKIFILISLLLLINGCGKISDDGFSTYSESTSFGDIKAQLYGTKSGVLFIHRKAPYELLLSFSFKLNDLKKARLKNLELINPNSHKPLFVRKDVELRTIPKSGELRIYINEPSVLTIYEKVELHIVLELETNSGSQDHEIRFLFNKKPTSRWWSFFELV
ncbi:MAG: hypothetical protein L3J69_07160 [Desulfobacula sp.]|nr:hypothetical protein [Desulfobacula sp.]